MALGLARLALGLALLSEAVRRCRCEDIQLMPGDSAKLPTSSLDPARSLTQDVSPGAMQWTLAVILSAILVAGLVRVFYVLRQGTPVVRAAPEGMRPVQCGGCRTVQYAGSQDRIFMCFSCRCANRVLPEFFMGGSELVVQSGPLRRFEFRKGGENFWQELKVEILAEERAPEEEADNTVAPVTIGRQVENDEEAGLARDRESEADINIVPVAIGQQLECDEEAGLPGDRESEGGGNELGVPQCIVCLDLPGSMVLLPCAHGGVCEQCATRIAQNQASGGAHCPHCRAQIQTLVQLLEVEGDVAKGIEYRIPIARRV